MERQETATMTAKQANDKDFQQIKMLSVLNDLFKSELNSVSSLHIASNLCVQHDKVVGTIKSLESRSQILLSEPKEQNFWVLTEEGKHYAVQGTPEARLFEFVKSQGKMALISELKNSCSSDVADIGMKNALRLKWLTMDKPTKSLVCVVDAIDDKVHSILKSIEKTNEVNEDDLEKLFTGEDILSQLHDLKKRKLIDVKKLKYYEITKGPQFSTELKKPATDLTQDMILNETWKDLEFKPYNFFAAGVKPQRGSIHPLMRVMKQFKNVLVSMQFEEMPTKCWIESSFWNFDTLFQPQQHPARDVQDTFYLKNPVLSNPKFVIHDYLQRVKEMHEHGGMESIGWRYDWSEKEAQKTILRTHTTANSARMLYHLAQQYQQTGLFIPKRYFSIDRVFRNETLDATHLAEFHQIEGVVCDKNVSLGDLMGVIQTFYKKIGISQLKFKPAYNPYTEPSMEIFGFHPLLNKWIEVGNSGVFRPEMLLPMGFTEDISVLGWGLSLERPTMIRYGIRNIRELFGHKATLGVA